MSIAYELISDVKKRLKITWEHQDQEIEEMIEEGIAYLQSKVGELPFSKSDKSDLAFISRKLLKDYVRYEWNGSGAYFETDYRSDLLNLQLVAACERSSEDET